MITACGLVNGKFHAKLDVSRLHKFLSGSNKVWADVENPTKEELDYLEKQLNLHHLALEDTLNERQRAKVERFDEFHFIVVHSITETEKLESTQLNLFIGRNFLVSIHLKHLGFIQKTRSLLRENPYLMARGADYVAYVLLDESADNLFPLMDRLEDLIDKMEEEVFKEKSNASKHVLNSLFKAKKQLLMLRKITWPQMEVMSIISSGELKYISKENLVYFRDVYDHLIRINSIIETQRELVSGSMEGHLMVISNTLNTVMKKLTAITAVIMLPALISGIYGMNFLFVPELGWEYGFYAILVTMLLATILISLFFKQKDWI
ncbi:MAG: magnesium/cobalt transporter CorA [Candidatus Micrarchaeota archaeon]